MTDNYPIVFEAITLADQMNQALGYTDLSPGALRTEAYSLFVLQRLTLRYAEQCLGPTDWLVVGRYAERLSRGERVTSTWPWKDIDLLNFALHDYLADHRKAGSGLLHEAVTIMRGNADDAWHDTYRRTGNNEYDALYATLEEEGELDAICENVVKQRGRQPAAQRYAASAAHAE